MRQVWVNLRRWILPPKIVFEILDSQQGASIALSFKIANIVTSCLSH